MSDVCHQGPVVLAKSLWLLGDELDFGTRAGCCCGPAPQQREYFRGHICHKNGSSITKKRDACKQSHPPKILNARK